jgi:hypothetical protein
MCALGGLVAFVVAVAIVSATGAATTTKEAATASRVLAELASEEMCVSSGPLSGLTAAQASNAEAVVAASATLTHEDAAAERIALMTAYDESTLHNLGAQGGNDGSLGLFQQRVAAGWGTAAEELDPTDATGMFVNRLLAVSGWASMRPWVAAQTVQGSGTGEPVVSAGNPTGTLGGNYERFWALAGQILDRVTASATAADCGGGPSGGEVGPPARYGLPVGYRIPVMTTPPAVRAIRFAVAQLGKPYVWGAAGPNAFDCSGLTMAAWAHGGVTLDHYTVSQEDEGLKVSTSRIAPGNLVLVPGSDPPGPGEPGHVGIYIGDSLVLSAVDPQYGVIVQAWSTFVGGGLDAVVDPLMAAST